MTELPEGTVVDGRYRVVSRLGTGGMADVFLAEDQQLGRKLALKLLHQRFAEDPGFVERFRREAQAAAGLQHPNVVSVYDRGAYDGTYYIAMEYVPGRTLKQVIGQEAPLGPVRAIDLVTEILKAVRFAHRHGVIHRDLKPHNVIVDDADHAKVTDFGIARAGASDMTETGSILGTAQYLSPEQAQGHAVSPTSDLYSIGVILYELLTGRVPFDAEAAVTVAIKHVSEPPIAPRTLNPLIPAELEQVVLWSLNKNPADRPVDAEEFLAALKHARAAIVSGTPGERTTAMTAVVAGAGLAAAADAAAPLAYPSALAEATPATAFASAGNGLGTQQEPEERKQGRRDLWLWLGLLALLLAAAAAAAVFLLTSANQVTVPSVVSKRLSVAERTLKGAGFKIKIAHVRSTRAAGVVIRQNPAAQTLANQGTTVHLTVSAGPVTMIVPQLRGTPLARAENLIHHAGLKVGKLQYVEDTQFPAGVVSSSTPFGGEAVPRGTAVKLFVSSGPPKVSVPGVTGETEAVARATLEAAGFSVGVTTSTTAGTPAGTVVSQTPGAGSQLTPGSTVSIVVAQRPPHRKAPPPTPTVTVPGVTGDTVGQARSTLTAAGFTVSQTSQTVKGKSKNGIVLSQSPAGGSKVKKGTTVTIVVGSFHKPPPPPPPTTTPTTPTTTTRTTGGPMFPGH